MLETRDRFFSLHILVDTREKSCVNYTQSGFSRTQDIESETPKNVSGTRKKNCAHLSGLAKKCVGMKDNYTLRIVAYEK